MSTLACPTDCGKCCDPVMMPYTQDDVRRMLPSEMDHENRDFVLTHLTPMSRREGLERSPYLRKGRGHTMMLVRDELTGLDHLVEAWSHFFSCDLFDAETRRCTDYEHRPPVCRDYPLYGHTVDSPEHAAKALPDGCVYLPDPARRREP